MDLTALGLWSSIIMLTVGSLSGIFSKCLSWREKWAFLCLWIYLLSLNLFPLLGPGSCSFPPAKHFCSLITPFSHLSSTFHLQALPYLQKPTNKQTKNHKETTTLYAYVLTKHLGNFSIFLISNSPPPSVPTLPWKSSQQADQWPPNAKPSPFFAWHLCSI